MISTNEELIQLIKDTYDAPIVSVGGYSNEVIVKFKGSKAQCTFGFRFMPKDDKYCADFFRGHNCLSYGFDYSNHESGLGYLNVADEEDQTNEIIEFIDTYLGKPKRKETKYIQMSIFDFSY